MSAGQIINAASTAITSPSKVTNIGELFDALAVGWVEGSPDNRILIATDRNRQFIKLPAIRGRHLYADMVDGDIPVESGGYRMRGFIKFESKFMFRDMFECEDAGGDNVTWIAKLTRLGYEAAISGVMTFNIDIPDIKRCSFFNPESRNIAKDAALTHAPILLGVPHD